MMLSKNLSLAEATKSATAIKHGIVNDPTPEHLQNLKDLAKNVFQPIREHFAKPLGISSGYRSEALNQRIGGSKTSQHCEGKAVDLDADIFGGVSNSDIFNYIKDNLDFDQLIWEFGNNENPDWVHVSYNEGANRKQILRASRVNGKTKYTYFE